MGKIKTTFLLEPIPDTKNYIITKLDNGKIIELGVRTNKQLIDQWGKQHTNSKTIISALLEMSEIELYD